MVENAIKEVYTSLLPKTVIIADLGCAAGSHSSHFISTVISTIVELCKSSGDDCVELQFFLNDLPSNDFNELFRSRLPESYYNRLFPREGVHLFHSSYCLHWRSQEPEGHESWRKDYLNEDNIYITKTTTSFVVKQYQKLFRNDFSLFLKLRHEELVHGGQMEMLFLGRNNEDVYNGHLNQHFALVARSLQSLVLKGIVEKEKLESFNLPVYGPSVGEVKELVMQSHLFNMDLIEQFESNWDPFDDSEGDDVEDSARSSMNIAKLARSLMKSLIIGHFGETVLDAWFAEFRCLVAKHLEKEKIKSTIIAMSLKKE
ncbi:hypothetical protein HU200_041683 [Digitaria exilis]|uniref:Uncharacterized protein n=1 Tax=Digitaria exilis TaxID=1010633 RepID=A0A835B6I1_9POAL|nr:hypothetical protein HU200_041683 [Digitaria exilis]